MFLQPMHSECLLLQFPNRLISSWEISRLIFFVPDLRRIRRITGWEISRLFFFVPDLRRITGWEISRLFFLYLIYVEWKGKKSIDLETVVWKSFFCPRANLTFLRCVWTMSSNMKTKLSPPPQYPFPPYVIPAHCNVPQLHQTSPHPATNVSPQHPPQTTPSQDPLHLWTSWTWHLRRPRLLL